MAVVPGPGNLDDQQFGNKANENAVNWRNAIETITAAKRLAG